jgi:hypothetical protein
LMTIAAYACFPQPLGPGFEDLTEPPIGPISALPADAV